jgi:peroxiredoxin Q/BCP
MIEAGMQAPAFTLKTDSGADLSLESLQGRRVVLFFFPKADTPG